VLLFEEHPLDKSRSFRNDQGVCVDDMSSPSSMVPPVRSPTSGAVTPGCSTAVASSSSSPSASSVTTASGSTSGCASSDSWTLRIPTLLRPSRSEGLQVQPGEALRRPGSSGGRRPAGHVSDVAGHRPSPSRIRPPGRRQRARRKVHAPVSPMPAPDLAHVGERGRRPL